MEAWKKKPSETPSPPATAMAPVFLSEVRRESPASAIGFSDSCPCCDNKKRRCLYPSSTPRKKLLVFGDDVSPSLPVASSPAPSLLASPAPSDPRPTVLSISSGPASSPSGSFREILQSPARGGGRSLCADAVVLNANANRSPEVQRGAPPPSPSESEDRGLLERSNSSVTPAKAVICSADECKEGVQHQEAEVRVGIRCRCGTVHEILLVN